VRTSPTGGLFQFRETTPATVCADRWGDDIIGGTRLQGGRQSCRAAAWQLCGEPAILPSTI